MAEREKLIELKDLQITFGSGKKKFVAVDHVNFMFNRKQEQRKEQMQDLASMFGSEESGERSDDLYSEPEEEAKSNYYGGGGSSRPKETIYASANAYRDMNRTLGNFYEIPKEDPEKEEMRKELEELREMAYNRQTEKETADEQLALLEKSDRKSTRLNSSHASKSRMPSSA